MRWLAAVRALPEAPPEVSSVPNSKARESLDQLAQISRLYRSRPGEWVTPARAVQDTENFVEYFHHGIPFEAESLLHTWSNCREVTRSEAECRALVEREFLRFPTLGASLEERVRECQESRLRGRTCQSGLDQTTALLDGPS
jgi:hypothetical protein